MTAVEVIDDVLVDLMRHFACHSLQDPRVSTFCMSWTQVVEALATMKSRPRS